MLLANAALSALVNLLVFAGLPFFSYLAYQKWRHQRTFGEISRRAGLQLGAGRYVAYSVVFALVEVAILAIWPPALPCAACLALCRDSQIRRPIRFKLRQVERSCRRTSARYAVREL